MAVISCSSSINLATEFFFPFSESANYLGMEYLGNFHTINGENDHEIESEFVSKVLRQT
ncbi:MAG: hypothetical protein GY816_12265 [Cytophagales bacterium]|nr:hypothetical protein [Cytophagales bacterium]